ncbi:hypothetical protein [Bradyrhizobium elkanii]|uniref:Uncharacterized protein n=1 Tax=Bradyrhizobium elkanii TaxID=29448 RepID=A0ABV4FAE3_BRAEL|nr:hypothetical protein [Bradyrhizobium elkanii]MCP1752012.1 hypothetical protein [Bradyrhizobium elkanii]MCP1977783.1 hypothetical protein [Bradyrhizobium elkanii]MCS3887700.1 hypothetical protein [Bradyrhizobium elkanii]MCS4213281.1 hypothetical protein [Bradyrhizobium elkanii]MCW2213588.1 hypothetical protein [Bradyrhizobium elkanii]
MKETSVKGLHYIDVRNDKGETTKAALETKFERIAVLSRRRSEAIARTKQRSMRPTTNRIAMTEVAMSLATSFPPPRLPSLTSLSPQSSWMRPDRAT